MVDSARLDLQGLSALANQALQKYEQMTGIVFDYNDSPFLLTPDKPNTARKVIQASYQGAPVGDLVAIVFLPEDGTGDDKTFKLDDLAIPQLLRYEERQERIFPRQKTGVEYEIFFPFFSLVHSGIRMFAVTLEELTVQGSSRPFSIARLQCLGLSPIGYSRALIANDEVPRMQLTTGYDENGVRFGDPHSIHSAHGSGVQVAGFLAINERYSPLAVLATSLVPFFVAGRSSTI